MSSKFSTRARTTELKDKVKFMDEGMQAVLSSHNTVLNEKVYQHHLREYVRVVHEVVKGC